MLANVTNNTIITAMESHIEQEESDSSRQSADLRIRKTQVPIYVVGVLIRQFETHIGIFVFITPLQPLFII